MPNISQPQQLTDAERQLAAQTFGAIAIAKAAIHDKLGELDKARTALVTAEGNFAGVAALINHSHGMAGGTFSPDLSTITAP